MIARNAAWINYRIQGGKSSNPNDIWPIEGEKKEVVKKVWGNTPEEVKANYDKILAAHRTVKRPQIKENG